MSEIHAAGVGPVLGDAGPPVTFPWNGRDWRLEHPTQSAKGELEKLVAAYSCENLEAMRGVYSPAKFAEKEKELDLAINGGHFRTGGALWLSATSGPDGNALFLLALLKVHQPDTTLAVARTIWCAGTRPMRLAMMQVIPGFFLSLAASLPLPDGRTLEEQAARVVEVWVAETGIPSPEVPSA